MSPAPPPLAQGPFIENPTDEDYADAARAALSAKDYKLALQQAAAAASLRPLHEPHVKLLDEAIAATKGPLQALELKPEGTFFGIVAARARALARLDRTREALDCLFQATTFTPRTPFLGWGVPWVAHARDARRVDPKVLALAIVQLVQAGTAVANLEAADAIAAKVAVAAGDGEGALVVARSRVLRALGRHEEALALLAGRSDWGSVVERAAVHRDRNELEERVRCFEEARALRPDDVATVLDLGDAYLDDARLEDAAGAYEKALVLEPSQPWAKASLAYVRFLTSGESMASPSDDDDRALALFIDAGAYVTRLSDPIDPVVSVLRSIARAPAGPEDRPVRVRVRTERPLAPSARMAFDLLLARLGREGALEVVHDSAAEARPGPLWRLDGSRYVPSGPRPSDDVMASIAAIAGTPFEWSVWRTTCATPGPGTAEELLTAMAHVPTPSGDSDVVQYVHAFQVAAAMRVALGPWPVETRLDALRGLLEGVGDWTSAAAWLGLRAMADTVAELRPTLEQRARAMVPAADDPLAPMARVLAVTGGELAEKKDRAPYLRLRARVRRELISP